MTDTRAITCCFTGHRQIPKVEYPAVRARLTYAIRDLYEKGYRRFVAGGAIGFDTLAAEIVLALRRHYPDVSLILMLPCADQDARWSSEDKAIYQKQKSEADEVILLAERYFDGCMQKETPPWWTRQAPASPISHTRAAARDKPSAWRKERDFRSSTPPRRHFFKNIRIETKRTQFFFKNRVLSAF